MNRINLNNDDDPIKKRLHQFDYINTFMYLQHKIVEMSRNLLNVCIINGFSFHVSYSFDTF